MVEKERGGTAASNVACFPASLGSSMELHASSKFESRFSNH
jgi:hypothetical protein